MNNACEKLLTVLDENKIVSHIVSERAIVNILCSESTLSLEDSTVGDYLKYFSLISNESEYFAFISH